MSRLRGSRVYLCGPIDDASDYGQGWRNDLKPFLKEQGIIYIDPCDKPIQDRYKEGPDFIKLRRQYKEKGDYEALSKMMKKVRIFDLRCVDVSDFLIVYLDLSVILCGTLEEVFCANKQKKPILIMCPQNRINVPDWIFGTINYRHIYDDWKSLKDYIEYVNTNEEEPEHFKRWTFFQYDKLISS